MDDMSHFTLTFSNITLSLYCSTIIGCMYMNSIPYGGMGSMQGIGRGNCHTADRDSKINTKCKRGRPGERREAREVIKKRKELDRNVSLQSEAHHYPQLWDDLPFVERVDDLFDGGSELPPCSCLLFLLFPEGAK